MPAELLRHALEQSQDCDALVRTMALLGASRVMASLNQTEAERLFVDGVASAESLSIPEQRRMLVLDQAVKIGATAHRVAAIDVFRRLPSSDRPPPRHITGTFLVQVLVKSGDIERALELIEDLTCDVGGAGAVVHSATDAGMKLRAMFAARERWHARHANASRFGSRWLDREFYPLVALHWRLLGPAEASRWLDEILLAIASDPDEPMGAGFGHSVELHSSRDFHLFHVLNMLRALRPVSDVKTILARHPDVAMAAHTFPLGYESVVRQPPPERIEGGGPTAAFCYVGSGSPREMELIPTMMAAHRGERSAVRTLFEEAHRVFQEDTDPTDGNLAPLAFWPSCVAYKRVLYWAGKIVGSEAKALVAEVPARELALLGSIELAAGLLGLDGFSWVQSTHRPGRARRRAF